MYRGLLRLGTTELANTRRTVAYFENMRCQTTLDVLHDDSWVDVHRYLQHPAYTTPTEDGAPWLVESRPETAEFLGVWVLNVEGMDSAPLAREGVESAGAGGGFPAPRWSIREMNFEALVVGATPAGLEYGLEWLNSALVQDQHQPLGGTREMLFLQSAPYVGWTASDEEVVAAGVEQERRLVDVVLTKPVVVDERFGAYLPDPSQSIVAKVSFSLSAGNPFVWKAPRELFRAVQLSKGREESVYFERVDEKGNWSGTVVPDDAALFDPALPKPVALPRPMTPFTAAGVMPFLSRRSVITVAGDLVRPWETMVPTVTIRAGARAERSVRVQWVRGSDIKRLAADSLGEAIVSYIPAGATLTLDGISGKATVVLAGESTVRDATSVVAGRNGAPWRPPLLRSGDEHTVVVDAARDVDPGVVVAATGSVRLN